jgi:hypothetical protein
MNERMEEQKAVFDFQQFVNRLSAARSGNGPADPPLVTDPMTVTREQMVDLFLKGKPELRKFRERLFQVHPSLHGYPVSRERWEDEAVKYVEARVTMNP